VLSEGVSLDPAIGGDDVIITGTGDDVVVAGVGKDLVNYVPAGSVASDPVNNNNGEPTQVGSSSGIDIVIGDNGIAIFDTNTGAKLLNKIRSFEPTLGDDDWIFTDTGPDVVVGGTGSDVIDAGSDEGGDLALDIVLADNGVAIFDVDTGESLLSQITTTDPEVDLSGDDRVTTGGGNDVVFGGSGDDEIDAGAGYFSDVVFGDNGGAWFYLSQILQFAYSIDPADGGDDIIATGNGADYVIAGVGNDLVDAGRDATGDREQDAVFGDNGQIDVNPFGQLIEIHTTAPIWGGMDAITTGGGPDIVFGGNSQDMIQSGLGNDHVNGDNGFAYFLDNDGNAGLFEIVQTTDPLIGGDDLIFAGGGYDVVFGGTNQDVIFGGADADLLLGDHGRFDRSLPADQNWYSIFTSNVDAGAADEIYGDDGEFADSNDLRADRFHDIIMGQQGADIIFGGPGDDDITGGHNVLGGDDGGDTIDGQAGADLILGDNGVIYRTVVEIDPEAAEAIEWATYPAPFADLRRRIVRYDEEDKIEGDDIINGGAGRDNVHGQRGDDIIDGGEGDDNLIGERGDDIIEGGQGNDIVLGGSGAVIPAFNADGTPRQNSDESWHRDVFLEELAVVSDYREVALDAVSSGQAAAILGADVVLAATIDPALIQSRDTLLVLLTLVDGGQDQLSGGSGDDVVFGQRGNDVLVSGDQPRTNAVANSSANDGDDLLSGGLGDDVLRAGSGDDLLVGDEFVNLLRLDLDLAEVVHGLRIVDDLAAVRPSVNGLALAFGGTVVVPPVTTSVADVLSQTAQPINTRTDLENGHRLELAQGQVLSAPLAIVPELFHNADMANGSDLLEAGFGDDIAVGDSLVLFADEFVGFSEVADAIADLRTELARLRNTLIEFNQMVERSDHLAAGLGSFHAGSAVAIGNDILHAAAVGGNARRDEGRDLLIGDNAQVAVSIIDPPFNVDTVEEDILTLHRTLRGAEHVAADVAIFTDTATRAVAAALGADAAIALGLHQLVAGNDLLDTDRDRGPDRSIGDANADSTGASVGATPLPASLRNRIAQVLVEQQAGTINSYTTHGVAPPTPPLPQVPAAVNNFVADANDQLVAGNGAAVSPGLLDRSNNIE